MTRLYDGKKIAEITMCIYEGNGYTPDWSNDFFDIGLLEYDEEHDAYKVKDVDYCIEQANDWKNSIGDFCNDVPNENNEVFVEIDDDPDDMRGAVRDWLADNNYQDGGEYDDLVIDWDSVRYDDEIGCWCMSCHDDERSYTLTLMDGMIDIHY